MRDNPENVFFVHSLEEPLHDGCRREVATYDNGKPIGWVDIPDGAGSWEPMYLCTEAARIYMMSDAEFDEYEREQRVNRIGDVSRKVIDGHLVWLVLIGVVLLASMIAAFAFRLWVAPLLLFLDVAYAGVAGFLFHGYRRANRSLSAVIDEGSEEAHVLGQLEGFDGADDLAGYAAECADQMVRMAEVAVQTDELLGDLFEEGSITWHRYHDTMSVARDRVTSNARMLLRLLAYASDDGSAEVRRVCMVKSSEVLADNRHVIDSVGDLCREMRSFALKDGVLGASSDVTDIVSEIGELSESLSRYR